MRGLVLGLVVAVFLAAAAGGVLALSGVIRGAPSEVSPSASARMSEAAKTGARAARREAQVRVSARRVLAAWDAARASAYSSGDARALGALYAPGSGTGAADVRLLRAYDDRGLHVEGMRMQVLAFAVRSTGPDRLVLSVTDRLVGAVAVGRGRRMVLPADRADRRRVTFVRHRGSWLVDEVR